FLAVALGRMSASARHVANIIESAAVADGPIKITVRAEHDASAIVIPIRLVDFQNDAFRRRVRRRGIASSRFEFTQAFGVIPLGGRARPPRRTIDGVEFMVGLELRMQRQTEQSALFHALAQWNY